MAKKISQLTQATQVKSDDVTVIVQDGETKKLPLNMMVTKQDIENKKVAGLAKLDEIETTYENDTYTPTIAVKNKSSVKVGEGDGVDYSANVMDGHVKSAILKGNTLVNLVNFENNLFRTTGTVTERQGNKVTFTTSTTGKFNLGCQLPALKANTKYLLKIKATSSLSANVTFYLLNVTSNDYIIANTTISNTVYSFTTNDVVDNIRLGFYRGQSVGDDTIVGEAVVCEYQEGMENWDIPYFEGMQSVKMPVLTTTGKNLFDVKWEEIDNHYISVNPNTTYVFSNNGTPRATHVTQYNSKYETISINQAVTNLVTCSNTCYITVSGGSNDRDKFQIEEGSVATSYEPYKSNILTVNEPIELRGIGDVQDTLDLTTGELTERIGEFVVNGTEDWRFSSVLSDTTAMFSLGNTFNSLTRFPEGFITDSAYPKRDVFGSERDFEGIELSTNNPRTIFMKVKKSSLNGWDETLSPVQKADLFKSLLSQNPITFQYQLATPTIKTVDLMPSGTHPSTTPYCWKNGHIQLSSSGLLPNLEYSVVTSRAGQINQNATMIVKNDKRIFDLEILLAGGLVNTTYQALTLQNQVETGLSKVSLNSETEPDYLLYHMIMKLIEEKAYKLDDLTEKVSVFYLYEKLSDEQFETIYSALYPFAEDEIIEEPVVEELPEVVEDEVIM